MASSPLGYSAPSAGFDAPLEMLGACHERIQGQCSTLRRLAAHVVAAGADGGARAAAHNVIRYFDSAGRHHHDDEEHDFFPALLEATAGSDPTGIRQLVDALKLDHRVLDAGWQKLRPWLARVEAGDASAPAQEEIEQFIAGYARHIAREERDLLPMAARLLGPGALERIGQSMRRRRGIGTGPASTRDPLPVTVDIRSQPSHPVSEQPTSTDVAMPIRDPEGYLVDPDEWNEQVAEAIASEIGITLTHDHWEAIRFMRRYYDDRRIAADARFVIKHLEILYPGEGRKRLFELFPYGYVGQACKVAGMKRPRAWSTG